MPSKWFCSIASISYAEEHSIADFAERVIRPGSSNASMEGKGPIHSAEGGVKANLTVASTETTVGAKVNDESGLDKTNAYSKTELTSQTRLGVNAKAYLKLNLNSPSSSEIKLKGTINLGNFYIQTNFNIPSGGFESIEFGVQAVGSTNPNLKVVMLVQPPPVPAPTTATP
ncbi:MAG: hypothetical protein SGJ15_14565 [Bacteroidota bacterium]|nr:hypothetical protein [Bacteroidota bacterium]